MNALRAAVALAAAAATVAFLFRGVPSANPQWRKWSPRWVVTVQRLTPPNRRDMLDTSASASHDKE